MAVIAAHDDFQRFLGGGQRQLAHVEIVDDQQWKGGELFHARSAAAVQGSVGRPLQ